MFAELQGTNYLKYASAVPEIIDLRRVSEHRVPACQVDENNRLTGRAKLVSADLSPI